MKKDRNTRILEAIDQYTKKFTGSPKEARDTLVREGIFDERGNLTPRYSKPGHQGPDCPWVPVKTS